MGVEIQGHLIGWRHGPNRKEVSRDQLRSEHIIDTLRTPPDKK
jgi:hypothetical protein